MRKSGVIANLAESEEDAIEQIKRFLSYFPQSVWQMPPRIEPEDDRDRREEGLVDALLHNPRAIYDPYPILKMVLGAIFI